MNAPVCPNAPTKARRAAVMAVPALPGRDLFPQPPPSQTARHRDARRNDRVRYDGPVIRQPHF